MCAWLSMSESLWLDELHSAWCLEDQGQQLARRAAMGNQLPIYFWGLRFVSETFGQSEIVLRSVSWVAWLLN